MAKSSLRRRGSSIASFLAKFSTETASKWWLAVSQLDSDGANDNVAQGREVLISPSGPRGTRVRNDLGLWVYEDVDFDDCDFSNRCLIGIEFRSCHFRGANFRGSDLSYVRFVDCDLYRADFTGAVLYASWVFDCDLTKAVLDRAFLSGIRLKNVDITHAIIGRDIPLGRVRKAVKISDSKSVPSNYFRTRLGHEIEDIRSIEEKWSGIYCEDFDRAIRFFDDPPREGWRRWRRREEIAKIIKLAQLANGYYERALYYYCLERRFRRRAMPWFSRKAVSRLFDMLFGEMLWAYGTSVVRPFLVYGAATAASSMALLAFPRIDKGSGLRVADCTDPGSCKPLGLHNIMGFDRIISEIGNVSYYLLTTAFGNSQYTAVGFGRVLFVAYEMLSLVLLSLVFASIARRLANI